MSDFLQVGDQVRVTVEGEVAWVGAEGHFRIGGIVFNRESDIFRDVRVVPRPLRVGDVVHGHALAGPQPEGAVFRSVETGWVWLRTASGYVSSAHGKSHAVILGPQFRDGGTFEVIYLP